MILSNGPSGTIEFGTLADNYWSDGVYDRTFTVNIPDVSAVTEFTLTQIAFDDWMSLRINGTFVGAAPYGGDRLELVNRIDYCWDGDNWGTWGCAYRQVQYGPNSFGNTELGRSWRQYPNSDLRPLLRSGINTIQTRTIVGNRGESWMQIRTNMLTCPSGFSRSGNLCVTSSSTPATASTTYSCPSGYTGSGSSCIRTTTTTASLSTTYSCNSGALVGTSCVSTTSTPATPTTTYTCAAGQTQSGTTCTQTTTTSATPSTGYTCSSGTLSGTSCVSTSSSAATASYSCAVGNLVGSSCVTTSSVPATWVPLTCPD